MKSKTSLMSWRYGAAAFPALAGLCLAQTALAQGVPDTPAGTSEQPPVIGEVTVTAQRFASLASKTPIALSAIEGEQLLKQGIDDPTELGDQVPNLSLVRNNGLQITIRGVTSNDNTEKGDPSAAFLLDGVYVARPQAQEVSFYDIDRVEVLRGPQGTLYGRNTTAGVINVITHRPKPFFEAAGNLTVGSFNSLRSDAMVNVPVSEGIALRFAGATERRDAYLVKEPGDTSDHDPFKNNYSFRAQALFQLGDTADLLIRGDYSSLGGRPHTVVTGGRFYAAIPTGQPAYTDPRYIGDQFSSEELRRIGFDMATDPDQNDKTWGIDGELNWDFGPLTLTYLGSYREFERDGRNAAIRAAGPYVTTFGGTFEQVSQELRFAVNNIDNLQAQFGAYYFREESINSLILPGVVGFEQGPTVSESYAFFGQATYSVIDALRVTAGGRYSNDDKSRVGRTFNPTTNALISPNNAAVVSDEFTWRLGVDYDIDERSMLYAVASTGYKAGGFNGGCEAGTPNCTAPRPNEALYYAPEELTAYEVGLKTRFAGNTVRVNTAAFYYDYANLQVSSIGSFGGVPQQITQNAAAATVTGLELETIFTPDDRHRIDASVNYLDAAYDEYFPLGTGNPPDFSGLQLDRAPEWTGNLGYSYTYPFGNNATLVFAARSRLSSEYSVSSQTTGQRFRQPGFRRSDLSVTFNAADNRYYLQGFVNNLEDDIQVTSAGITLGALTVTPSDPRTYGARMGFRF